MEKFGQDKLDIWMPEIRDGDAPLHLLMDKIFPTCKEAKGKEFAAAERATQLKMKRKVN